MGRRSWTAGRSCSTSARRFGRAFFDRPANVVAPELLGATLRVNGSGGPRSVRLVEVEAYLRGDPASHAFRGPTRRNRSMFGPPGTLYVFRIHRVVCANLVARVGEAVLLRAGAPARGQLPNSSGPGRLCRALGVTIEDDGIDVTENARVRLVPGRRVPAGRIVRSPRIGIHRAVRRLLRYSVRGDPWVSRPRP